MIKTIEAIYDGAVLRPTEPLPLEPNTPVRITIETVEANAEELASFLDVAASLKLDGPPDWAENLHAYLYGPVVCFDARARNTRSSHV